MFTTIFPSFSELPVTPFFGLPILLLYDASTFKEHTANFAIEMDQVSTKVSSSTQKCVDFSGIFVFVIGPKIKELFQLFEGPGQVK